MSHRLFAMFALLMGLLPNGVGPLEAAGGDPSPGSADSGSQEGRALQRRAAALVRRLGDPSFSTRRQAARDLRELGLPALPVLRQAVDDVDLEIRYRAQRLLKEVRLIVHAERLKRFQADPESIADDELPGLKRYRETIGSDAAAQKLFVQMQRAETDLFLCLEEDRESEESRKQLSEEIASRCTRIRYTLSTPAGRRQLVASASALMFISADPRVTASQDATVTIYNLGNYNEFRSELGAKSAPTPLRRLAENWIARSSGDGAVQRLLFALRNDLKAGLVPALDALRAGGNPQEVQYALLTVGRFGTREDIPAVEKLFDDRTMLAISKNKSGTIFSSEMRDVALAVVLHLSGQDARKGYGFARLNPHAQYLFVPNTAGFADEAQRTAAFQKWTRWKADEAKKGN